MRGGGATANAREIAARTLTACARQGAWSDGHLKKAIRAGGLDRRDAALATRLCFGVLQNALYLDHCLQAFSSRDVHTLDAGVLSALRVGAYQLLFLDKIPPSAAVNEAVVTVKRTTRSPGAAGFVNGVLRAMVRSPERVPQPPQGLDSASLSLAYSHPRWLTEAFLARLGPEGTRGLLACHNQQPPTTAQVNTLRTDTEGLCRALAEEGVEAEPHPWLPGCVTFTGSGDLEGLESFRRGLFYVQDAAARLAVLAADPRPGMRVLDACAAPGGKSFAAALAMGGQGSIVSCDIHPHKIDLIRAGAGRLGLACISAQVLDGKECKEEYLDGFDLVMADVPCSGLGIIRKKPDIRYKDPGPLAGLPGVQRAILDNVSRYVKPGGALLYATCTLLERENEGVVEAFLADHPGFVPEPFPLPLAGLGEGGMATLWPHLHGTDGFFMAKLRKRHD